MHTQKGIAPIIIALIVALLASGGYVVVKTNPGLAKKLGMEKQVEKEETKADKKGETANWKTYKNEKYGFKFSIPKDWATTQESTGKTFSESSVSVTSPDYKTVLHPGELEYYELVQGGRITIYVQEPSPKSIRTLKELSDFNKLGRDGGPDFKNERVIVVNDEDALLYDYEGGSRGGRGHKLELLSENRWVSIEIQYVTADGSKIWAEILSTLEFTK
ncbi:MAG: hypothetical protein UY50_C0024G0012 [Parcubacteria group bacterium GW2011_GWA2_49_9]|nr:MAG: hypothetical protein UY50_C0024G0012 [Parcubacteria group bacterium GW2011_GWA2_49_9]